VLALAAALGLALAGIARAAPPFLRGIRDHSVCCGLKVPLNVDGIPLDYSDPAYAKVLASHEPSLAPEPLASDAPSPSAAPTAPVTPTEPPTPATPAAPASPTPPIENPNSKSENPPPSPPPSRPILRLPGPPLSALDGRLETQSGYAKIAFSQLAGFPFTAPTEPLAPGTPPPDLLAQVPASVRRLDGKKVVLSGFMLPTKMENGFATEFFFLSSSQLCCFGVTPSANEWMIVKMKKEGLPAVQDVPMSLAGRLRVRAQWTDGFLTSIYELEGDGLLKTKS
jgi:hypothetical protein